MWYHYGTTVPKEAYHTCRSALEVPCCRCRYDESPSIKGPYLGPFDSWRLPHLDLDPLRNHWVLSIRVSFCSSNALASTKTPILERSVTQT